MSFQHQRMRQTDCGRTENVNPTLSSGNSAA